MLYFMYGSWVEYIFINDAIPLDFRAQKFPLIFPS